MILKGFRNHPKFDHYADFVALLFGIGCRFGEAVALRWKHLSDDFRTVWIGESYSRGHLKGTKTNKPRTVILSPSMREMLRSRFNQQQPETDDLVFPAVKGGNICDRNFRNRAWKTILEQCQISYRKPYTTRHTAIRHALEGGANPVDVAKQTGHDLKILLDVYADVIKAQQVFQEF